MISINKDLIGSPHKTIISGNLFDFIKNRENMNMCVSEKFVFKIASSVFFKLNFLWIKQKNN